MADYGGVSGGAAKSGWGVLIRCGWPVVWPIYFLKWVWDCSNIPTILCYFQFWPLIFVEFGYLARTFLSSNFLGKSS